MSPIPEVPLITLIEPVTIELVKKYQHVNIKIEGEVVASVFWSSGNRDPSLNGPRILWNESYGLGADHEYAKVFANVLEVAAKIARIHPDGFPDVIHTFERKPR